MFRTIFACVAFLILSYGCTRIVQDDPSVTLIDTPAKGTLVTARVGDAIVAYGVEVRREAVRLNEDILVGPFGAYTLVHGYFLQRGRAGDTPVFRSMKGPAGGQAFASSLADPIRYVTFDFEDSKACVVSVFGIRTCRRDVDLTWSRRADPTDDHRIQRLYFNGRLDDKLLLTYEGTLDDRYAPARRLDLEYDLSGSPFIAFREVRIKVRRADNQSIVYEVLSGFDDPRLE